MINGFSFLMYYVQQYNATTFVPFSAMHHESLPDSNLAFFRNHKSICSCKKFFYVNEPKAIYFSA